MATPNLLYGNPHSDRPFAWRAWRFSPGLLTGEVNITVASLPAGTIILDAALVVIQLEAGATSVVCDIEVGATGIGDTNLITGPADFGGAALGAVENTVTEANLGTINAVSLGGAPLVVNAEIIYVGTATTRPVYDLHLLFGRFQY